MHFQTWSNKADKAAPLTAVDPVTGVSVTFPDLEVDDELFNKSLIMSEPCPFLDRSLPIVSIIRPAKTQRAAMGGDFSLSLKCFSRKYSPLRGRCATSLVSRVST
jgi:hypothetical protein